MRSEVLRGARHHPQRTRVGREDRVHAGEGRAEALRKFQRKLETRMSALARIEMDNHTFVAHRLTPVACRQETACAFDYVLSKRERTCAIDTDQPRRVLFALRLGVDVDQRQDAEGI